VSALRDAMREKAREIFRGCSDSSCRLSPPGGMRTNGGCRCRDKLETLLCDVWNEGYDDGREDGRAEVCE
jgi:hypothetical protein